MNTSLPGDAGPLLRAAEERIMAAIAARDIAGLEAELTDDFAHTSIGGAEQDRGSFLDAIRDAPYRILELRGEQLQVRAMGDLAILSGVQRARVALPDGSVVTGLGAFVDLFVLTSVGWRLRHACSVELPDDTAGEAGD
jgi:ketosteroid isomerase-like protein